jgi:hypothetical protein
VGQGDQVRIAEPEPDGRGCSEPSGGGDRITPEDGLQCAQVVHVPLLDTIRLATLGKSPAGTSSPAASPRHVAHVKQAECDPERAARSSAGVAVTLTLLEGARPRRVTRNVLTGEIPSRGEQLKIINRDRRTLVRGRQRGARTAPRLPPVIAPAPFERVLVSHLLHRFPTSALPTQLPAAVRHLPPHGTVTLKRFGRVHVQAWLPRSR